LIWHASDLGMVTSLMVSYTRDVKKKWGFLSKKN
jgi:hypothetical protein